MQDPFGDPSSNLQESTRGLMAAVRSVPELTAKKRIVEKHLTIASALMGEIKRRGLDRAHGVALSMSEGKVCVGGGVGVCVYVGGWVSRCLCLGLCPCPCPCLCLCLSSLLAVFV